MGSESQKNTCFFYLPWVGALVPPKHLEAAFQRTTVAVSSTWPSVSPLQTYKRGAITSGP